MSDVHSKRIRSYNMSQIRGRDTKPELMVRKFLHSHGFRFRLYNRKLPGKPDIILPKYNTVILIHGCFWHHHKECKFARFPQKNSTYWTPKIINNIDRDKQNVKALKQLGWQVITIWTCKLRPAYNGRTLASLLNKLRLLL